MKLFSEWLVENAEDGLPKVGEQIAEIVSQLEKQREEDPVHVLIPYHWVEGNDLVSSDDDPCNIEEFFVKGDILEQAGIEGPIRKFNIGTQGEKISISFEIPGNHERETQWQQHGFSDEGDYNNYRFSGRNW